MVMRWRIQYHIVILPKYLIAPLWETVQYFAKFLRNISEKYNVKHENTLKMQKYLSKYLKFLRFLQFE